MKFGLVFKQEIRKAEEFVQLAKDYLKLKGHTVLEKDLKDADYILSFGGDGTLIHKSCELAELKVPFVGINTGRLGFLTACEAVNWQLGLEKLISKEVFLTERMTIEAKIVTGSDLLVTSKKPATGNQQSETSFRGVNEVVIKGIYRSIDLEVEVNGEKFMQIEGDGVIIASPTGSTAYSLSSGGPIVQPEVESFLITPINPIGLPIPSFVVSAKSDIVIRLVKGDDVSLVVDGREHTKVMENQSVVVLKGKYNIKFGYFEKEHFLKSLNVKFGLGKRVLT